jgi:tRNA 5-methylaminomethyl-2-thiouridine biosynthesis bifunctional protein
MTEQIQVTTADIEWRENGVPVSTQFGDVYFSSTNGLEESRYVFLQHNQLTQRWKNLSNNTFNIIETGFGTGLNFLAAWQLWQQSASTNCQLHFISIEKYPLTKQQLSQALAHWPELKPLADQLIANYPHPIPGQHRLEFNAGKVCLSLIFDDVETALTDIQPTNIQCDAWFLDGFAPSKNPAMWSLQTLEHIAALSKLDTSFATFTAVGRIRRDLQQLGFEVTKSKGYGIKRDMLSGTFKQHSSSVMQWYSPLKHSSDFKDSGVNNTSVNSVALIGAGLAGAHLAYGLAKLGIETHVFEAQDNCAQGGSGNDQGILYTRLSHERLHLSEFSLTALLYSYRYYQQLFDAGILTEQEDGQLMGSIQLAFNNKTKVLHEKLKQRFSNDSLVKWLSPAEISEIAGIETEYSGIYLSDSGWLNPRQVCKKLLQQPNITLHTNTKIDALSYTDGWQLSGGPTTKFDAVVICNASGAKAYSQSTALPLKSIRGQISYIPLADTAPRPLLPVCYEGYLPPPQNNQQCVGATFNLNDSSTQVSLVDHRTNLAQLQQYLPTYYSSIMNREVVAENLTGRASVRCATPDYTPIAGQLADREKFIEKYLPLSRNAKRNISGAAPLLPNCYVSVGYGSRGLSYSPLCAQHIISQITNTPSPLPSKLVKATHPARFILRDIVKGKLNIEN